MPPGHVGPSALRSQEVHGSEASQKGPAQDTTASPEIQWGYSLTSGNKLYLTAGQVRLLLFNVFRKPW